MKAPRKLDRSYMRNCRLGLIWQSVHRSMRAIYECQTGKPAPKYGVFLCNDAGTVHAHLP